MSNSREHLVANAGWFAGEQHEPFLFEGNGTGGALLIHGFMGTPYELRPVGHLMNELGYETLGMLLPGFGPEIACLEQFSRHDWYRAAERQWARLHAQGQADILIGYSMGASIAMMLASVLPPRKLVLFAPLWRVIGGDWKLKFLPILKHVVRQVKPFRSADFQDPDIRVFFESALPGIDLDDPEVRSALRHGISIRTSVIDELRRLSENAGRVADRIRCEVIIFQGIDDRTVFPNDTRELAAKFPGGATLVELNADHLIVADDRPSWNTVRDELVEFIAGDCAVRS